MYTVEKSWHFHYAHRNALLGQGHKCARLHGHTGYVTAYFAFEEMNDNGVTTLFTDVDAICEPIVKELCHWTIIWDKDIELKEAFEKGRLDHYTVDFPTSAENFARYFFNKFRSAGLPVIEIAYKETTSSIVRYRPPAPPHVLD